MKSLYALKYWYTRRLGFVVSASVRRGISPDFWTAVGVAAAALGAWAIVEGWWVAAFAFLAARLGGANLDGAVARARGVSRPFGFVLNEIGDRLSDFLIMAGLVGLSVRTDSPTSTTALLLAATAAATLPTFVSLCAAGAGAPRLNGGPFGKTERCLTAVLAAAFPQHLTVFGWIVIAGSLATFAVRLAKTRRALRGTVGPAPADRAAPAPPPDVAALGRNGEVKEEGAVAQKRAVGEERAAGQNDAKGNAAETDEARGERAEEEFE